MDIRSLTAEILNPNSQHTDPISLLAFINSIYDQTAITSDDLKSNFIDADFLEEINQITNENVVKFRFGQSLRNIQCIYTDALDREHVLHFKYLGKNKFVISSLTLPPSSYHKQTFSKLDALVRAFTKQVDSLQCYFAELERIDELCTVVDPPEPSFKYDYRKILLDTRVWLHISVTSEGLPANMSIVGNVAPWHQQLQDGLRTWDYDHSIPDNVLQIFNLPHFPSTIPEMSILTIQLSKPPLANVGTVCGICLCGRGPTGAPLPLCSNDKCGVYFHRECLYIWLVSCGARAPLGLAAGACPHCGHGVHCAATDS